LGTFRSPRRWGSEIESVAERFGLSDVLDVTADELPFGKQRLVGIAMSVAACTTFPAVLLLDEPLAGMNDVEMATALSILDDLRGQGFSILMIEHNMAAVSQAADRIYVFENGRNLVDGDPAVVLRDPRVTEAYLGTDIGDEALPGSKGDL
jgi:branched-chain amino acid transport system ATP-binding protein